MQRDAIREREKKRRQRKQQALPGVDLGRDCTAAGSMFTPRRKAGAT
jgi:hypothetical protein